MNITKMYVRSMLLFLFLFLYFLLFLSCGVGDKGREGRKEGMYVVFGFSNFFFFFFSLFWEFLDYV